MPHRSIIPLRRLLLSLAFISTPLAFAAAQEKPSEASEPAKAVSNTPDRAPDFSDDFNREEPVAGKEHIGNDWTTNSAWRAGGRQQVDLIEGVMHVARDAKADHGVAIFHPLELRDGVVQLRFQLGRGDDLSLDFVDRQLKTVHAGHLCVVRVRLNRLTLTDSKTGVMDLKIREQRMAGNVSPEVATLLKTKTASFPLKLKEQDWHTLRVTIRGDRFSAQIDGVDVGSLQSEGIAHPTKRMITLGVNKKAQVDDLKAWVLDAAK